MFVSNSRNRKLTPVTSEARGQSAGGGRERTGCRKEQGSFKN